MSQLGPAVKSFEIIYNDTVSGFGGSRSKNRYMHLLVDHFTRYAYILSSKIQVASDFIKLVESITNNEEIGMALSIERIQKNPEKKIYQLSLQP